MSQENKVTFPPDPEEGDTYQDASGVWWQFTCPMPAMDPLWVLCPGVDGLGSEWRWPPGIRAWVRSPDDDDALDAMVHEEHDQMAKALNNAGKKAQLSFLVRDRGIKPGDVLDRLRHECCSPALVKELFGGPGDAWGQHPDYTRSEWMAAVSDEDTLLGYWEWVANEKFNDRLDQVSGHGDDDTGED